MALWENGAEGTDNGISLTVGNSGSSGDTFGIVSATGGGTITYSTAQAAVGDTSYLVHAPVSGIALARWSQTSPTHRFRAYIRVPAFPASAVNIIQLRASSTATGAGLQINAVGNLMWADSGGSAQNIYTLSTNTWYMVSAMVTRGTTSSNGYLKVEVRNVAGTAVLGSYESSARNTGLEDLTFTQFGKLTGSNAEISIYFDQVAMDIGSGELIGPYISGEPQLSISQQTYHVVDVSDSLSGNGGALTYIASWVSGPTLTVTQPQPGVFYFAQNTSAASAYTITVNEAGGTSDSMEITIPAGTLGMQTVNNSAPLFPGGNVPGSVWI